MITILSFIVVLGVLVFFHELGHYWVARRNGIVVEEFGMGYPPRVVKLFRYDGTDFTINLIPFGGFARMRGEDMGDMTPGSFNAASMGARAATLAAGPAMNALLAIVLFAASFMAGFPAVVGHVQVTDVVGGSTAASVGVEPGDVLVSLGDAPVLISGSPGVDFDRILSKQAAPGTATTLSVMRDGAIIELPLAASLTTEELLADLSVAPVLVTEVINVAPGSPAEAAGFEPGDLIYSVNDAVIGAASPLNEVINRHLGESITVDVLRGESWVSLTVTPRVDPPPGEGALGVQIGPASELATLPLLPALWQGVRSTAEYILLVLQLPVLLFAGQISPSEAQLTGPVGIAQMVGGAVNATIDTGYWFPIWRLSAVLSAALAITNLLPLPALDGGRLLFILFEAIRGRRVNPEREGLIHMVGFMVLLGLLVLVTVRDITSAQQGIDWVSILGQ